MANKIVLKKSSVVGRVPQLTDLDWGEVALNYADGRLYFKRSSNAIDYFSTGTGSGGNEELPTTYTTTTVTQEIIDQVSITSCRSGKYEIQLTSPLGYQRVELSFIHNGLNVFTSTNNSIDSGSGALGTFSAQLGNSNVQIVFIANHVDTTLVFTKKIVAPAGTGPNLIPEDLESGNGVIDLELGDGTIDNGLLPTPSGTVPEDLESGSSSIDLETGNDTLDLNGTTEIVPQDLSSGSGTLDLETGNDTLDLTL